jgi:hypothetical protein
MFDRTALLKRSTLFATASHTHRELWVHSLHVLVKLIRSTDPLVADRTPSVIGMGTWVTINNRRVWLMIPFEASLVEGDAEIERAAVSEADAITPLALLFAGTPPSVSGNIQPQ